MKSLQSYQEHLVKYCIDGCLTKTKLCYIWMNAFSFILLKDNFLKLWWTIIGVEMIQMGTQLLCLEITSVGYMMPGLMVTNGRRGPNFGRCGACVYFCLNVTWKLCSVLLCGRVAMRKVLLALMSSNWWNKMLRMIKEKREITLMVILSYRTSGGTVFHTVYLLLVSLELSE